MALTLALESCRSDGGVAVVEEGHNNSSKVMVRERLFEKVVTPSDVGKLNRLVVPKHFAEKHLPLLGAAARGGTVLCFHDARGGSATWRFRYSYWGSSQSYVMTKGWSRYVRDKRLAAGDTVSFCRDGTRLYIDCRRRGSAKRGAPTTSSAVPPVPVLVPAHAASLLFGDSTGNKVQQLFLAPPADVVDNARRGRSLRLFGVDLMELRSTAEQPRLLDLQL